AVVFHQQLPVGPERVVLAETDLGPFQAVRLDEWLNHAAGRLEVRWLVGEADVKEAGEHLHMSTMQRIPRFVEIRSHPPRRRQAAVGFVDPWMIRTDQFAGVSGRLSAYSRAAMPADIIVGAHFTLVVANDDQGIAADREREVVARTWNLAGIAGEQPAI